MLCGMYPLCRIPTLLEQQLEGALRDIHPHASAVTLIGRGLEIDGVQNDIVPSQKCVTMQR